MRHPVIRQAIRFFLFTFVLAAACHFFGRAFLEWLIPLFRWQISNLGDGYRILGFNIDCLNKECAYSLKVTLSKPVYVNGQFIFPNENGFANASSIVNRVWQELVLFLSFIYSWPGRWSQYVLRSLVAIPLLLVMLMFDTPLVLLSALWQIILEQLGKEDFSSLVLWDNFLEGGGRLAMGLAGGGFTIWLADSILLCADLLRKKI